MSKLWRVIATNPRTKKRIGKKDGFSLRGLAEDFAHLFHKKNPMMRVDVQGYEVGPHKAPRWVGPKTAKGRARFAKRATASSKRRRNPSPTRPTATRRNARLTTWLVEVFEPGEGLDIHTVEQYELYRDAMARAKEFRLKGFKVRVVEGPLYRTDRVTARKNPTPPFNSTCPSRPNPTRPTAPRPNAASYVSPLNKAKEWFRVKAYLFHGKTSAPPVEQLFRSREAAEEWARQMKRMDYKIVISSELDLPPRRRRNPTRLAPRRNTVLNCVSAEQAKSLVESYKAQGFESGRKGLQVWVKDNPAKRPIKRNPFDLQHIEEAADRYEELHAQPPGEAVIDQVPIKELVQLGHVHEITYERIPPAPGDAPGQLYTHDFDEPGARGPADIAVNRDGTALLITDTEFSFDPAKQGIL